MSGQRYIVSKHWDRWAVYDQAELRGDPLSLHDTREQADAACARRNQRDSGYTRAPRRAS